MSNTNIGTSVPKLRTRIVAGLLVGSALGVRRQNIWHKLWLRLAERLPRLIG